MAKEPYYVNPEPAFEIRGRKRFINEITQFLDGELFYQQKWPQNFYHKRAYFFDNVNGRKPVRDSDMEQIDALLTAKKKYFSLIPKELRSGPYDYLRGWNIYK